MLAALLETKVEAVVSAVATGTQDVYAGEPVGSNLKLAKQRLALYQTGEQERHFSSIGTALLDDVAAALEQRNALVHRVWAHAGMTGWGGWKPLRKRQRDRSSQWFISWDDVSPDDLMNLIAKMVELIERISAFIACFPESRT